MFRRITKAHNGGMNRIRYTMCASATNKCKSQAIFFDGDCVVRVCECIYIAHRTKTRESKTKGPVEPDVIIILFIQKEKKNFYYYFCLVVFFLCALGMLILFTASCVCVCVLFSFGDDIDGISIHLRFNMLFARSVWFSSIQLARTHTDPIVVH